ncbi:M15 family metallopeptidase [Sphingomonas sp.]|jgi:D-alanyl-D-alanine carboxypeptidase|uniref:M15 family metallopeptidase n=1 Tax=Sphingomonas sp. TaxID=28214 RepID=UPI002E32A775|nr:M15 family metallopeptidase [Sphingomonas sp.]HEX4693085.1 M15 family metallopeptidase [Sphingomonas sp.]
MRLRWLFGFLAGILPAAALALTPVTLCPGQNIEPMPDGRMLGHLPYAEANPADIVTIPNDFGVGRPCEMHRDAAVAMEQLLAAANLDPAVKGRLRGVSCFRTIERQRQIFCSQIGPKKRCANAAERAKSSGPPGYSEHATGYALDFGIRPLAKGCGDVSDCIARTPPGRWLLQHAAEFGFELSFPPGNAQGVTWEPWHWRWVGVTAATPGAARARALFATARTRFPAMPMVPDVPIPPEWRAVIGPAPAPTPTPVWPQR